MGFGHRVYRAEDPRSRVLKRTAPSSARRASRSRRRSSRRARGLAGAPSRPRARDERRVLVGGRARRRGYPAGPRAGDVRLFARRRLVGSHPRAEAHRPADPAVGALRRARGPHARGRLMTLADAAAQADALAKAGDERALAELRAQWDEELEVAARASDFRDRAQSPSARSGSSASGRRSSSCDAGSRTTALRARIGAPLARVASRRITRVVNDVRPLLHEMVTNDGNEAVRRLAVVCPEERLVACPTRSSSSRPCRERRAAARAARGGREDRPWLRRKGRG